MADENLIVSIVWFVVLGVILFGVSFYFHRLRYNKYGRQINLLDAMRMHRNKTPESVNRNAPIMSGEDILNYVVPDMAVPVANPCPIL